MLHDDNEASDRVIVPDIPTFLDAPQLSILKTIVDPLESCDDNGKSYYIATRQLVREMLATSSVA